jgi:hypothetical protein
MKCLIVREPYVSQILDGSKVVEYRSRPANIRGVIGLIASGGKGRVLGTVELYDCRAGTCDYEWLVRGAVRFTERRVVEQRPGCVVWVDAPGLAP